MGGGSEVKLWKQQVKEKERPLQDQRETLISLRTLRFTIQKIRDLMV